MSDLEKPLKKRIEENNGPFIGYVNRLISDSHMHFLTFKEYSEIYTENLRIIDECIEILKDEKSFDFSLFMIEIKHILKEYQKKNVLSRSFGVISVYENNDDIPLRNICNFLHKVNNKMTACDQYKSYILCHDNKSMGFVKEHGRSVINDDSTEYNSIIRSVIENNSINNVNGDGSTYRYNVDLYEVDDDFIDKARFLLSSGHQGLSYMIYVGKNYVDTKCVGDY